MTSSLMTWRTRWRKRRKTQAHLYGGSRGPPSASLSRQAEPLQRGCCVAASRSRGQGRSMCSRWRKPGVWQGFAAAPFDLARSPAPGGPRVIAELHVREPSDVLAGGVEDVLQAEVEDVEPAYFGVAARKRHAAEENLFAVWRPSVGEGLQSSAVVVGERDAVCSVEAHGEEVGGLELDGVCVSAEENPLAVWRPVRIEGIDPEGGDTADVGAVGGHDLDRPLVFRLSGRVRANERDLRAVRRPSRLAVCRARALLCELRQMAPVGVHREDGDARRVLVDDRPERSLERDLLAVGRIGWIVVAEA